MAMMRWFRTFLGSVSLALMRCGILFRVCEEGEKGRDGMCYESTRPVCVCL